MYRVKQTDDFVQIANGGGIEFRALVREDLTGQNYVSDNFEVYSPELEIGEAITGNIIETEEITRDEEFIDRTDKIFKTIESRNNYALLVQTQRSRMTDIPSADEVDSYGKIF